MKEEQKTSESSGLFGRSTENKGGLFGSVFKDIEDFQKSIWDDYSRIEHDMEKRFKEYSDLIEQNRQRQIQE